MVIINNVLAISIRNETYFRIREIFPLFQVNTILDEIVLDSDPGFNDAVCKLYENFADICSIMSGFEKARHYLDVGEKIYKNVLTIRFKTQPLNERLLAKNFSDISIIYYDKLEYNTALDYASKCLEIRKKIYKDKLDLELAYGFSIMSRYYKALGCDDLALQFEDESFKVRNAIYPADKKEVNNVFLATGFQQLARVYYSKQKDKLAMDYVLRSIEILKHTLGNLSVKLANTYEDAGLICLSKNEYKTAWDYFFLALDIYKTIYGETHCKVAMVYRSMGMFYKNQGNYKVALEYLQKRLELVMNIFAIDDPYTANAFEDIATVLNA